MAFPVFDRHFVQFCSCSNRSTGADLNLRKILFWFFQVLHCDQKYSVTEYETWISLILVAIRKTRLRSPAQFLTPACQMRAIQNLIDLEFTSSAIFNPVWSVCLRSSIVGNRDRDILPPLVFYQSLRVTMLPSRTSSKISTVRETKHFLRKAVGPFYVLRFSDGHSVCEFSCGYVRIVSMTKIVWNSAGKWFGLC